MLVPPRQYQCCIQQGSMILLVSTYILLYRKGQFDRYTTLLTLFDEYLHVAHF